MNTIKKLIFTIVLLNMVALSHAMAPKSTSIQLPPASVINQRLEDLGLRYFLEKTKIDQQLGNQKKYPIGVALTVELSLSDFAKTVGNPVASRLMQMQKPEIIKAILQDFPEAIAELEKQGVLDSNKANL